jgi:hypothetical protein
MRFLAICFLAISGIAQAAENPAPVSFSRDVLPKLSENCFLCRGPDEKARKANLRQDIPECLQARAKRRPGGHRRPKP